MSNNFAYEVFGVNKNNWWSKKKIKDHYKCYEIKVIDETESK